MKTIPPTFALADDPQVWEFTAYTEEHGWKHNIVCIGRWQVIPCKGRIHHRRLTGQWEYTVEGARKLWTELKANGAEPFAGWLD